MSSQEDIAKSTDLSKETMPTSHGSSTDAADARAKQVKSQIDSLRQRINIDARAMMKGLWGDVKRPYKPKKVADEKDQQWRAELQRQEKINAWMATASKPSKNRSLEESRYRVIMAMRNDSGFEKVVKKIPPPTKPASMEKPAPAPNPTPPLELATPPISLPVALPVTINKPSTASPATLKRKASGEIIEFKQEIIDVDNDDEELEPEAPQSDYEPEDEAALKRENRANKRQRTGDLATRSKQSASEEDLEFQLEELRLKGQLQEMQLRRKIAAVKRAKEVAK